MLRPLQARQLSCAKALLKGLPLSFKVVNEHPTNPDLPPLLLLHGFLSSKREWKALGKTLSNLTKRSVAVADLRNHGNSPRSPSHTYEPQRIHSLVIVDTSPVAPSTDHITVFPEILKAMMTVDFTKESRPRLQSAKRRAHKILGPIVKNDFLMSTILSNINLTESKTKWSCNLDALQQHLPRLAVFPPQLHGRSCPAQTLFIGGQLSEHLPADDLPGIRALFPAAVVRYVPKTGHYVHAEDPARFLELAIGFLLNDGAL